MKVVLLRVGIDSGSGGMQGPLFKDGSFDYIPIPDGRNVDSRKYGNTKGRHGRMMVEYFPEPRRKTMAGQSIHLDQNFDTNLYGDPDRSKGWAAIPPERGGSGRVGSSHLGLTRRL